jgi:hypothetical protein
MSGEAFYEALMSLAEDCTDSVPANEMLDATVQFAANHLACYIVSAEVVDGLKTSRQEVATRLIHHFATQLCQNLAALPAPSRN